MKIAGVDPTTLPSEVFLVIPRGDTQIVFKAQPARDMDAFEALCPRPTPPGKLTRDGYVPMEKDPSYQVILANWASQRLGYMVVKSLEPSQIEWDTVSADNPQTYRNWSKDLLAGGLSDIECHRVLNLVLEANCLDETKLKQAREVFLAGQEPKPTSSGLPTEPASTPSGALASA